MRASERPDASDRCPCFVCAIGRRRSGLPHLAISSWVSLHHISAAIIWSDLFKPLFLKTCIAGASTLPEWHVNGIGVESSVLSHSLVLTLDYVYRDEGGEDAICESKLDTMAHISRNSERGSDGCFHHFIVP